MGGDRTGLDHRRSHGELRLLRDGGGSRCRRPTILRACAHSPAGGADCQHVPDGRRVFLLNVHVRPHCRPSAADREHCRRCADANVAQIDPPRHVDCDDGGRACCHVATVPRYQVRPAQSRSRRRFDRRLGGPSRVPHVYTGRLSAQPDPVRAAYAQLADWLPQTVSKEQRLSR